MQGREANYQQSRGGYLDLLQNGQQAFNDSARAAVEAAMPSFNAQLNSIRESAARRGVSNGELGTSYEGDLASALSRNLDNSIAGQALGLYNSRLGGYSDLSRTDLGAEEASTNRYFDANASELDRMDRERDRKQRSQLGWAKLGVDLIGNLFPGSSGSGGGVG
jgi:hypothetical protein